MFKVLKNGRSFHGGNFVWSLPQFDGHVWVPGQWHQHDGDLVMCGSGFHITSDPGKWWADGCTVYSILFENLLVKDDPTKAKYVCGKVSLIQVVPMIKIEGGKWQVSYNENKSSGWDDPQKVK